MEKALASKIVSYRESKRMTVKDRKDYSRACKRLEKRLEVAIEPREYRFLLGIGEQVRMGDKVDLKGLAKQAGYPDWMCRRPESLILRGINDSVFDEVVGITGKDFKTELKKMIEQDDDLAAKGRGLEIARKVLGMGDADKQNINIITGIKIAD